MLDTGQNPRMGFEPQPLNSNNEMANEFFERMKLAQEEAKAALAKAKDDMAMYSTRRTSGSHPLIPPDPALSPPASVLPPPASVLVPPDSPFLHRRIPDSRFIVAPRAPHITIQFLQGTVQFYQATRSSYIPCAHQARAP
ncbi:hypothetical protein LshimejAT787_0903340 [Lyophyllum shimeji]|uniref:Uncharacterized protein n=1 Tax=Lyophyllum shimeji TaxID=47721 RepID=A0A9P3PT68_LYOSH|nr:hypothetical protein LshimejAT787_0903340 [Lyophyllum shimeji]